MLVQGFLTWTNQSCLTNVRPMNMPVEVPLRSCLVFQSQLIRVRLLSTFPCPKDLIRFHSCRIWHWVSQYWLVCGLRVSKSDGLAYERGRGAGWRESLPGAKQSSVNSLLCPWT